MDDRKPGRRRLKAGLIAAAVGGVIGALGLFLAWPTFSQVFNTPAASVPGTFDRELEPGVYVVSMLTTRSETNGPVTVRRFNGVEVESVAVRAPDGSELQLEPAGNESVTRGNKGYSAIVRFEARVNGRYTVDVQTAAPTEALVTPSIFGLGAKSGAGIALGFIGSLLLVGGLVAALIGFFRSQERNPPPPSSTPSTALPPAPAASGTTGPAQEG